MLSHEFSVVETSDNFDIYLLDPTSSSGWQTMQGAGQTEFKPLFSYFVNNKTGQNQTLKLNYNFNLSPSQRLFQRTLQPGWNTIGIASPSYALFQGSTSSDTNNPSNILSPIISSIGQVIDFTNGNINLDSPAVSGTWLSKTASDANGLNDFRELKGYGVFVTSVTNNYLGSQNLQVTTGVAPVITLNGNPTVNLIVNGSYADAGATASDSLDGDITANIVVVNPVKTNVVGTYTITYNVTDSSGNNAQQVTRTVNVGITPATLGVTQNGSYTNQVISPNTANAKIGSYTLQNQSSSESIRVTSLAVALTTDGSTALTSSTTPALTNFSNLKTSETSGSGSTPIQPSAVNTFSVDFTIAPGATKIIDIFTDTGSQATSATVVSKLTVTSLGTNSNVSISQNSNGTAVTGQIITLISGSLTNPPTLVLSSSTAGQYVPSGTTGSTNATKATYNFRAANGSATISELKFIVTTSTGISVSSVTVNGVSAPVVSSIAYLTGLNIAVPNGGSGVNVDVFMSYGPVGIDGSISGATSQIALEYIKYTSGGTTTTLCPITLGTCGVEMTGPVTAPTMVIVGSKPTLEVVDSSAQLVNGLVKVGSVTIAADTHGDIAINTLPLAFSSTGQVSSALTNLVIKNAYGQSIINTTNTAVALTAGNSDGRALITFTGGYTVTAGITATLDIYATATTVTGGPSANVLSMNLGTDQSLFTWTDVAGNGSTAGQTGTLLYNFPTNSSWIND